MGREGLGVECLILPHESPEWRERSEGYVTSVLSAKQPAGCRSAPPSSHRGPGVCSSQPGCGDFAGSRFYSCSQKIQSPNPASLRAPLLPSPPPTYLA